MELWARYMIQELKGYPVTFKEARRKTGWKELKAKKVVWRVPDPEAADITTEVIPIPPNGWEIIQEWTGPQP